jgi:hypothetical protein
MNKKSIAVGDPNENMNPDTTSNRMLLDVSVAQE